MLESPEEIGNMSWIFRNISTFLYVFNEVVLVLLPGWHNDAAGNLLFVQLLDRGQDLAEGTPFLLCDQPSKMFSCIYTSQ